jgi:hypothetical protein
LRVEAGDGGQGKHDQGRAPGCRSCYAGAVVTARATSRQVTSRVIRNASALPADSDWEAATPTERIAAVWELTRQCLAWNRKGDDEPRLQRSISRVQRSWR